MLLWVYHSHSTLKRSVWYKFYLMGNTFICPLIHVISSKMYLQLWFTHAVDKENPFKGKKTITFTEHPDIVNCSYGNFQPHTDTVSNNNNRRWYMGAVALTTPIALENWCLLKNEHFRGFVVFFSLFNFNDPMCWLKLDLVLNLTTRGNMSPVHGCFIGHCYNVFMYSLWCSRVEKANGNQIDVVM